MDPCQRGTAGGSAFPNPLCGGSSSAAPRAGKKEKTKVAEAGGGAPARGGLLGRDAPFGSRGWHWIYIKAIHFIILETSTLAGFLNDKRSPRKLRFQEYKKCVPFVLRRIALPAALSPAPAPHAARSPGPAGSGERPRAALPLCLQCCARGPVLEERR